MTAFIDFYLLGGICNLFNIFASSCAGFKNKRGIGQRGNQILLNSQWVSEFLSASNKFRAGVMCVMAVVMPGLPV